MVRCYPWTRIFSPRWPRYPKRAVSPLGLDRLVMLSTGAHAHRADVQWTRLPA